jgi:hypothetical protein
MAFFTNLQANFFRESYNNNTGTGLQYPFWMTVFTLGPMQGFCNALVSRVTILRPLFGNAIHRQLNFLPLSLTRSIFVLDGLDGPVTRNEW